MSHRALVAVARDDGTFDVYVTPDGAADRTLEGLVDAEAGLPPAFVEGPPTGSAQSVTDLLATHLDPVVHEALVVVGPDGRVTPHAVLPVAVATADGLSRSEPTGMVLSLVGRDGSVLRPGYVRGWYQGTGELLGEAVDAGLLAPEQAVEWLQVAIERLAGGNHDVTLVPPEG